MSSNEEKIATVISSVFAPRLSFEEARVVATLFTPENLRLWINMCQLSKVNKTEESTTKIPIPSRSDGESSSPSSSSSISGSPDSISGVSSKFENLMRSSSPSSSDSKSSLSITPPSSPVKSSAPMETHVHRASSSTSSDGTSGSANSPSTSQDQSGATSQSAPQAHVKSTYARMSVGGRAPKYRFQAKKYCKMCHQNGEPYQKYTNHNLKDKNGFVTCPVLFKYTCELCGACGQFAHTRSYCPVAIYLKRFLPPGHPAYARLMNFKFSSPTAQLTQRNFAQ